MATMETDNDSNREPWYSSMADRVPIPSDTTSTNSEPNQNSLFVGSLSAVANELFLREKNITHILTVAKGLYVKIPQDKDGKSRQHKIVACHDHPMADMLQVLPECLDFIQEGLTHGSVLVHCASGVSRSVTVCAAFLMMHYQTSAKDALGLMCSTRKYANPNIGFRRQLELLERHGGDIAAAQATWSQQHSFLVQDTQRQREVVNQLHARVDALEEIVAAKMSKEVDGETKASFMDDMVQLVRLQSELDSCLPAEGDGLVDPPSKMMRKSAAAKVERLLISLEKKE